MERLLERYLKKIRMSKVIKSKDDLKGVINISDNIIRIEHIEIKRRMEREKHILNIDRPF